MQEHCQQDSKDTGMLPHTLVRVYMYMLLHTCVSVYMYIDVLRMCGVDSDIYHTCMYMYI